MRNRIAETRERDGRSQIQLAEFLEMSQGQISKIENEIHCPSIEVCYKIEEYFGLDIHELLMPERGSIMFYGNATLKREVNLGKYIELEMQIHDKRAIYRLHSFLQYLASHQDQRPEPQVETHKTH